MLGGPQTRVAPPVAAIERTTKTRDRMLRAASWLRAWWLPVVLMVVGAALRIRQWAFGRSMWGDELFIAHNLRGRDFLELLEPLRFSQSAPPGWLWLERLSLLAFGPGERSLRLVPLLFGLALLPLVAYFCARLLPKAVAWAAVLLVSIGPFLISYSNEVKQYSSEAFWVTLLVFLAVLFSRGRWSWRRRLGFWLTSAVAVTMSSLAIPVSAALAMVLAIRIGADPATPRGERWREVGRLVALSPVWAAVATWTYVWVLRPGQMDAALQAYWSRQPVYPDRPLTDVSATWRWLDATVDNLVRVPFVAWSSGVFVLMLAIGAILCWQRMGGIAVVALVAPLAVGVAGVALAIYPLTGRLALYAVPACLILISFGVASIDRQFSGLDRARRGLSLLLLLGFAMPQVLVNARAALDPATAYKQGGGGNLADYRGSLEYIAERRRPDDVLLATPQSWNAQAYYGPPVDGYVLPSGPEGCPGLTVATLLAGRTRVWLFQATESGGPDEDLLVERFGPGAKVTERQFRGARVAQFVLPAHGAGPTTVCLVPAPHVAGYA